MLSIIHLLAISCLHVCVYLYIAFITFKDYESIWKSVAAHLGCKWSELAKFLGFTDEEIDSIRVQHQTDLPSQLCLFREKVNLPNLEDDKCHELVVKMLREAGLIEAARKVETAKFT